MPLSCKKSCIYNISPYNMVCSYCKRGPGRFVTGGEYYDLYIDNYHLNISAQNHDMTKNNRFLVGNIASVLLSEVVKIKIEKFSSIKVVITVKLKDATFETISMYDNYDDAKKAYDKMMIKYSEE